MTKKQKKSAYLDPLHSIGYLSRINFRAFNKALEQLIAPHKVSQGQWRFLRVLWEEDGLTQKDMSDRVGITEATTVNGVLGLEEAGLVTRRKSKVDARKMMVRLTPKARSLRNKLIPMVVKVNEQALKGIKKKDIVVARRVLTQTFNNLTSEDD